LSTFATRTSAATFPSRARRQQPQPRPRPPPVCLKDDAAVPVLAS
jgi:hypothetical protein